MMWSYLLMGLSTAGIAAFFSFPDDARELVVVLAAGSQFFMAGMQCAKKIHRIP